MKPGACDIHIDTLVLEGVDAGDAPGVGEAVVRHLTQIFRDQGLPESLRESRRVDTLDGAVINLSPGRPPDALGARIAAAVYEVLRR